MATERIREQLSRALTVEDLETRRREGWRAVAIEWERPATSHDGEVLLEAEVPYGLQIADDCLHLRENPTERRAMTLMLELIVDDHPLSKVADELNRRGYTTRRGSPWAQASVFDLLPRLTEAAPEIFSTQGWSEQRKQRFRVV